MKRITLSSCVCLLLFCALRFDAVAQDVTTSNSWSLRPALGKVVQGRMEWENGSNWTASQGNSLSDAGATWRLAVQPGKNPWIGDSYVDMIPGVIHNQAAWLHPGTELQYRGRTLIAKAADATPHASPAVALIFLPPKAGWYRIAAKGSLKVQIPSAGRAEAGFYVIDRDETVRSVATFSAGLGAAQETPVAVDATVRFGEGTRLVARVQTINPGPASADRSWLSLPELTIASVTEPNHPETLPMIEKPAVSLPHAARPVPHAPLTLPLAPLPEGFHADLLRRDGPALEAQEADFLLDSFEDETPRHQFVKLRGNPNVRVDVRDGIASHGSRSLHVDMQPPTEEGYHEAGLVWRFDPPIDLSAFDGFTADIRAHFDEATRFFVILSEPDGVLWRGTLELEPNRAGQWQSITIPNAYIWYHEGRHGDPPRRRIDHTDPAMTRIASVRFRLYAGIRSPLVFDLDGIGFVRDRLGYQGPSLTIGGRAIRRDGKPFDMTVRVGGTPLAEAAELLLATVDFAGKTNWLGRAELPPDTHAAAIPAGIPGTDPGFRTLIALLRVGSTPIVQASRGLASLVPMSEEDAGPNSDSIFGVWVGGNPREVGAKWTRQYVWGNQLGEDPSVMEGEPPGAVRRRKPEGVDSILHFTYTPKWLSSRPDATDYGKYPPRDWEAYGRYIEWVVGATKPGGYKHYEIWNEPNPHAYWHGTVDELVKLAEVTYKAVKRVDPDAKVLGPCPYGFTFDFIEAFFAKGGTNWIDDVVVHTYAPPPPDDAFVSGLRELKALMTRYGLGDRDIYITEMGYSTPGVDERDIAAYLVRAYVYAWVEGVRVVIWHMLQALSDDGDPGFALKYKNDTPRPAYVAYAVMTRMIEGATLIGAAPGLTDGQRGFDFERRGVRIRVLWDRDLPRGESSEYLLRIPAGHEARKVNLMGAGVELKPEADGTTRVPIEADPLYIMLQPAPGRLP